MNNGMRPPFGGNLLPPGAIRAEVKLGQDGSPDHISVVRDGSHTSYDRFSDGSITGLHGRTHRLIPGGPHTI